MDPTSSSCSATMSSTLALGAGCYWGTEKYIKKDFQKIHPNSIKSASVGFMSPDPNAMKNPSYRQVCSGSTGHVEVLNIELSQESTNEQVMEDLIRFFFQFHDPTTANRQGNDAGTQYASAIFTNDDAQERIANKVKAELQALLDAGKVNAYYGKTVETYITGANTFYEAHEEHQEYLMKHPNGYWCVFYSCQCCFYSFTSFHISHLLILSCLVSFVWYFIFVFVFVFVFDCDSNHRIRFRDWPDLN